MMVREEDLQVEINLPAMGGKKTASTAKKISELHMAPEGRERRMWRKLCSITCKTSEEVAKSEDNNEK